MEPIAFDPCRLLCLLEGVQRELVPKVSPILVGEDLFLIPAAKLAQQLLDLGYDVEEEATGLLSLRAFTDEQ